MDDLLDIEVIGSKVLRQRAEEIKEITPEILELAESMLETMYDAPGVGLAAPQVGHPIRLVVVDAEYTDDDAEPSPIIAINPVITPIADCELVEDEEGCLSVPDIFARVSRPEFIKLEYTDENGEYVVEEKLGGFKARVFQHEIDHLDGVLFVDKMNPKDRVMHESKLKKMARQNKS